ncbi:MAG: 16S rRNA (cytosine(1402)-N(4))-methyltransferase RsmH [Planctomycetota bacterium]|nr:16S rRNA (cytosine(1402)-N(4))-methyltransferase RsmH [Planctomycetota bacterium]
MSDAHSLPTVPGLAGHRSVLLTEVIALLNPQPGQCVVDCTLGAGGHSAALLERLKPGGRLIGLDVDPEALAIARARLTPLAEAAHVALDIVQANFRRVAAVLQELNAPPPNGILADLGVSSLQFDRPERGFSFRFDQPLDMRMDPTLPRTAADILREASEAELADILFHLGQEYRARAVARAIVARRREEPLTTTGQLEALVRRALRIRGHRRIHPATKTFQALRLAVNHEMDVLATFLSEAPELLAPGGTLAIMTFHSLEDRQVKQRYKALAATGRFQLPVKFVRPGAQELGENPRSRSAKLRGLRRS